jgi:hypothetical protein
MPTDDIADIITDDEDIPKAELRLWLSEVESEGLGMTVVQAVGDGVTDDTAAIQNTIDAAGENACIWLPPGTFKVTSTLQISQNRVQLRGAGIHVTQILFMPSADDTCIAVSNGANIVYQGSISDLSFYTTDSTHSKIAIDLVDVSNYKLNRLTIGGSTVYNGTSYWAGADTSVGIRTKGRELLEARNLLIAADRPVQFSKNPNYATIDCDHFHFSDCGLVGHANPIISVDNTGMFITQLTFDGYQAWALGTHGFNWIDTLTTGVSNGLTFRNVRREQVESAASYFFNIQHNTNCQNVKFEACYGPGDGKGMYLRKCVDVRFDRHYHVTATEALNVDGTVARMSGAGCFWQAGSTVVASGQRQLFGTPKSPATGALPPNFIYDLDANTSRDITVGGGLSQPIITVANASSAPIGPTGTAGLLTVVDSEGRSGEFVLKGTSNAVVELHDPDSVYSAVAGTASSTNVIWVPVNARYEIENLRGGERRYKILLKGTYETF